MSNILSDEEIENIHITKIPQHNNSIELLPYQKEWVSLFEREKERILSALGKKALLIEHIGSTSVPELCAKPIIDILLVVRDAGNEEEYVLPLITKGYILWIKEPDFENHHMFKGPDTNINLHVFSKGSKEIEKYLVFRNYLRNHQEARELYASTKEKLAKKTWKYVQNYADAKTTVVQQIMQQALEDKK